MWASRAGRGSAVLTPGCFGKDAAEQRARGASSVLGALGRRGQVPSFVLAGLGLCPWLGCKVLVLKE